MKKENKKSNDVIVLKKDDILSIVIISILVLSVIFMGSLFIKSVRYGDELERKETLLQNSKQSYYDTYLNLIVNYPNDWLLGQIDLTEASNAVIESAAGLSFDMEEHTLNNDIMSLMLFGDLTETGGYGKFMSLSFKGDKALRGKELERNLSEILQREIEVTGANDVQVTKTEVVNDKSIYIEAECILDGKKIYYSQYSSVIGKNIGTALLGETEMSQNRKTNVFELVDGIIIKNLEGLSIPQTPNNNVIQQPVTTDNLNPSEFKIGR